MRTQALRQLAPHSGAYVSEADPTEPDWQQTFWGAHYPRLLALKRKWDPAGVFWCRPCVGSELWTATPVDAVGQDAVAICRTGGDFSSRARERERGGRIRDTLYREPQWARIFPFYFFFLKKKPNVGSC